MDTMFAFWGPLPVFGALASTALLEMALLKYRSRSARRREQERQEELLAQIRKHLDRISGEDTPSARATWRGLRPFRVVRKDRQGDGIYAFHLAPRDGEATPRFSPGQSVRVRVSIEGRDERRAFSLTSSPEVRDHYRIVVRKVGPRFQGEGTPIGRVSNHLCNRVGVGDVLDLEAPEGEFVAGTDPGTPVVLVGAGIGVAPLYPLAVQLLQEGPDREVHAVLSVRNDGVFPLREDWTSLARLYPRLQLRVHHTRPSGDGGPARTGRVGPDDLARIQGLKAADLYICAPETLTRELAGGLRSRGVDPGRVRCLDFKAPVDADTIHRVTFIRSGRISSWRRSLGSLKDMASRCRIELSCDDDCAGDCGVSLLVGRIRTPGGVVEAPASVCPSRCEPMTDVVLDV